jgi:type VI secretion system secreted protein Hcp
MAFDAYLQITGIPGESTDSAHSDWIEVLSYSWGVTQPASSTASSAGGATTQRADFHDFTVTKLLDKASPILAYTCASGQHLATVVLELCRAGGDKVKYMEYKMEEVIISSCSVGGDKTDVPMETITFNYAKITWTYTQQKRADGTAGGQIPKTWNLTTNTP